MSAIPFTQYVRPSGRAVDVSIDRPTEVSDKAQAIIDAGYRFEAEVLSDGMISLTITDDDADHAIKLCQNGPGLVAKAVDELVLGFDLPVEISRA